MLSQLEKSHAFRALHQQAGAFIIPNPWDAGSASLLELLGFQALASTSAGFAFSQALPDNGVGRERMMRHLAELSAVTNLPLSADLENGFGASPETVMETIRMAADAGVVGGSIEDTSGNPDAPVYDLALSAERIRAAVAAARALPFPFTLTARADNYLVGRTDLKDTIARLQAYQEAGADVLFAPGLKSREEIATVLAEVDRPVNVIMGLPGVDLTLADLAELGVKRVSVGGSLARAALGAFLRAARELREHGTFGYADQAVSSREMLEMMGQAVKRRSSAGE